ncbi:MAG TPA: hypothetical protein VGU20_02700 [Stellaceae bacterium]|nr:hypothetical protein [Stellaceae bacterium]
MLGARIVVTLDAALPSPLSGSPRPWSAWFYAAFLIFHHFTRADRDRICAWRDPLKVVLRDGGKERAPATLDRQRLSPEVPCGYML